MWPSQQQQPRPPIGARPDPAGHFGQSLPSLGLGSEGKQVVRASLTFLVCQTSWPVLLPPQPQPCQVFLEVTLPLLCLSSGLDTQKAPGTWLGGTQAPGGCPDYAVTLSGEAQSCGCSPHTPPITPPRPPVTPSCQPTTDLGRQLVARAGSFSPSLNLPFPEPRPGCGGHSP